MSSISNSGLADETPLSAGLCAEKTLDLNAELNPPYSASGEIVQGRAQFTARDVPNGS